MTRCVIAVSRRNALLEAEQVPRCIGDLSEQLGDNRKADAHNAGIDETVNCRVDFADILQRNLPLVA